MSKITLTQRDIDSAHEAIQRIFQEFASKVQDDLPGVHAIFGKQSNQRFPLYSYVTLVDERLPDVDPAVAAVDVRLQGGRVMVKTDLIGEETGKVYLAPVSQTLAVGPDQAQWLARLTNMAQELTDLALPVVKRMFEQARPAPPPSVPELARKA